MLIHVDITGGRTFLYGRLKSLAGPRFSPFLEGRDGRHATLVLTSLFPREEMRMVLRCGREGFHIGDVFDKLVERMSLLERSLILHAKLNLTCTAGETRQANYDQATPHKDRADKNHLQTITYTA